MFTGNEDYPLLYKNDAGEPCALVTNIQKYTIHDGPGIRTEIFFSGCPLRCLWCSNPEALDTNPRIGVYPAKCLTLDKCGACIRACPINGAPLEFENGVLKAVRQRSDSARRPTMEQGCAQRLVHIQGSSKPPARGRFHLK